MIMNESALGAEIGQNKKLSSLCRATVGQSEPILLGGLSRSNQFYLISHFQNFVHSCISTVSKVKFVGEQLILLGEKMFSVFNKDTCGICHRLEVQTGRLLLWPVWQLPAQKVCIQCIDMKSLTRMCGLPLKL